MLRLVGVIFGSFLLVLAAGCVALTPPATAPQSGAVATAEPAEVAPFDARFIDSMIDHSRGALTMAEQMLTVSDRAEMVAWAEAVAADRRAAGEQLQAWRAAWFPELAPTPGLVLDLGDMSVSMDESVPFEQRLMQALIAHRKAGILLAEAALDESVRTEVRAWAEKNLATQRAETEQLRAWLAEWYGVRE